MDLADQHRGQERDREVHDEVDQRVLVGTAERGQEGLVPDHLDPVVDAVERLVVGEQVTVVGERDHQAAQDRVGVEGEEQQHGRPDEQVAGQRVAPRLLAQASDGLPPGGGVGALGRVLMGHWSRSFLRQRGAAASTSAWPARP